MLKFKKMEYEDYEKVKSYFELDNERRGEDNGGVICDLVFGTTYMWREYYNVRYAEYGDSLILMASGGGAEMFSFPMGGDIKSALEAIKDYAHGIGMAVYFCFISESDLHYFYEAFEIVFPSEERDWFDYVYDKRLITEYPGKSYHGQKNFVNRYKKMNPECSFVKVNGENAGVVLGFVEEWYEKYSDRSPMSEAERKAVYELLEDWDKYNMTGGFITSKNGISGFTVGEVMGDTVFIHVEKADHSLPGAYQYLSSEYLRSIEDENVRYVNREEDMGIPGLRKSKTDLHPIKMLKKYTLYCC